MQQNKAGMLSSKTGIILIVIAMMLNLSLRTEESFEAFKSSEMVSGGINGIAYCFFSFQSGVDDISSAQEYCRQSQLRTDSQWYFINSHINGSALSYQLSRLASGLQYGFENDRKSIILKLRI